MNLETLQQEVRAAQERIAALQVRSEQSDSDVAVAAIEELQGTLEELQVAQEELRLQNEELMEARLLEAAARDRYQDLFESAPDAYLVTDLDGKIQEANRVASRLLCRALPYLQRKPLSVYVAEESRRAFRANLLHLSRGEAVPAWEICLQPRGGSPVDMEAIVTAIEEPGGAPKALRWLLRDITARKQAEAQVQALNADLEQRVRERTAALESALAAQRETEAQVEALNARLRRAMQETHHRVKNNLQIIASMVDMQMQDCADTVPAGELRRLGDYALILAAVHELLTQEYQREEPATSLSVRAVLEKLLLLMQQTAGARRIRYRLEEGRIAARQATSLVLIANELVNNALKHGTGDVEVTLSVREDWMVLDVENDGPGFPADFDPQRTASTGMELVLNLTRLDLGGNIDFSNRPEGGTKVTVTLPILPA